nr:RagB/SusD family nutrient uptake outer membrane protein [Bacteroides acidifaciens]
MKKIITICAFAACLTGCDDLFEPAIENNLGLEYMYENSQYAEGILANAYTRIPCAGYSFNDVATDDAVSNDAENSWRKIASGMWTANNNPADRWTSCRSAIQYINLFLANADKVKWAKDEVVAQMFCDREKAEAYGLRAMYMYYLLEAHAGYTEDGVLMGVPILTEPEAAGSNFNVPRSTFVDCMKALKEDALLQCPATCTAEFQSYLNTHYIVHCRGTRTYMISFRIYVSITIRYTREARLYKQCHIIRHVILTL